MILNYFRPGRLILSLLLLGTTSGAFAQSPESKSKEDKDISKDFDDLLKEDKKKKSDKKSESRPGPRSLLEWKDRTGRSYNLDMMAAVDFTGEWDNEHVHTTKNEAQIREAELGIFAVIDHLAQGKLLMAAHQENGETVFEVHEAFFFFPVTPIPRTSIKVGQFFYDVGHLNTRHRHGWSFTNAPIVHEKLLDEEAVSDTGAEFRFLMPWNFWQELSVGVFNGKVFGHSHNEGFSKNNPLYTLHLKQFANLGNNWGLQFGFSWMRWHPTENPRRVTQQSGIDLLLKWTRGKLRSFQFSGEVWYRETRQKRRDMFEDAAPPVETRLGGYGFFEYQFHQNWFAGLRFDAFTDPNKRGELGYKVLNGEVAESIMLTYKPSEFSFFRATVERSTDMGTGKRDFQYYLQADFLIGKHPAHKY